ncbi:MAG: hypothetical protein IPO22_23955 [Anaerolineales bacterium]|nr:hypothetical protein [Anaerolineales bacterium]
MIYVLMLWLTGNTQRRPGWSSLMGITLLTSASGIIMIFVAVGVYVGYIFQEVKRRPICPAF